MPAIRTGKEFVDWIEVDLKDVARVNRVEFGNPTSVAGGAVRAVKRVLAQAVVMSDPLVLRDVGEADLEATAGVLELSSAVVTRKMRFTILEVSGPDDGTVPIAVNEWEQLRRTLETMSFF